MREDLSQPENDGLVVPNLPLRQHIHCVVRTPNGIDYGKDLLRQHYQSRTRVGALSLALPDQPAQAHEREEEDGRA